MIIKRETHKQVDPLILWDITLPEGASKGRPLAAYDENGNSHEWDSWALEANHLFINFGIDPVAGELEYEYQVEGDEPIVIGHDGNNVTITVNQYGGAASTPAVFQ